MNLDIDSVGSITAAELSWGNNDHIRALEPLFDFIIGTDVVYAEHLLEPLLHKMLALSGPKTTILATPWLKKGGALLYKPIYSAVLSRMKKLRPMNKLKQLPLKHVYRPCSSNCYFR